MLAIDAAFVDTSFFMTCVHLSDLRVLERKQERYHQKIAKVRS